MIFDTDILSMLGKIDRIDLLKKKENGYFHVEMDVPEEKIDELLSDEMSQWMA